MANPPANSNQASEIKPVCGIIMPIAAMLPKYEANHWSDVRKVFDAAIVKAGMTPRIVSDSFETDVIQQRIISNLYENPVVVCDVSGLNPNVMFELGMRITFKRPVIIVTDDFGSIPFDTKVIEHLGYPRDLHIHQTNEFIDKLASRISAFYEQQASGTFKSFIEAFGTYEVLEPTKKVVEIDQLILDRLDDLSHTVSKLADNNSRRNRVQNLTTNPFNKLLAMDFGKDTPDSVVNALTNSIRKSFPEIEFEVSKGPNGQVTVTLPTDATDERGLIAFRHWIAATLPKEILELVAFREAYRL